MFERARLVTLILFSTWKRFRKRGLENIEDGKQRRDYAVSRLIGRLKSICRK